MAQFKTRARALDLLGRQQIAGIPTAINELLKNAYDAYADHFDISLLRKDGLLVLRDDGVGMSRFDFENRWLILGTESKVKSSNNLPPIDETKPFRQVSGEKGIGRLAIASIGGQVLVLSRPKNSDKNSIVASFLDWDLFELQGVNLEDIVVPVVEYDSMPSGNEIAELVADVKLNVKDLFERGQISQLDYERLLDSLENISISPVELSSQLQGNFDLNQLSGTHFYISNLNESLYIDLQREQGADEATKMQTTLLGFHNTMTPDHDKPAIDIAFRDYQDEDGTFVSIIDSQQFFTPEEFLLADHRIKGEFDKYGQFHGTITLYGEREVEYNVNWKDNVYRATSCGPFKIDFAYLQGEGKDSRISDVNYSKLFNKTNQIGGLYIYRNNIRVLPYGNSDYDFLDIEKNRSKRASTYFFSYRRIFGAIDVQDTSHSSLVEKAGREGFIENLAYKQFRAILKNFFWQLAQEIFCDKANSSLADYYRQKKEEYNKAHKALQMQEKRAKNKKDKFLKKLALFFELLSVNEYQKRVDDILLHFKNAIAGLQYKKNPDEASQCLLDAESKVRKDILDYQNSIEVPSIKGFYVGKNYVKDYELYKKQYRILDEEVFKPALVEVDRLIEEIVSQLQIELSKRRRLENAVTVISENAAKMTKSKTAELNAAAKLVTEKVREVSNQLMQDLEAQIQDVRSQFQVLAVQRQEDFDIVQERIRLETQIDTIKDRNTDIMERIIRQLEGIQIHRLETGEVITNQDLEESLYEELEELRSQVNSDLELSQLGLAIGIIHHEFSSTVDSIRRSVKDLKAWSDVEQNLQPLYKNVSVNFEHLESYLGLMTPLNRRMERERIDIPLTDIRLYLSDLFGSRLQRHEISLKHTNGFAGQHLNGFRSTFYPVFVNIVDNAIYWLKQSDVNPRIIRLHATDDAIYISNNGPSIPKNEWERIFNLRYSRKPNGRGLGLSISREILNDEGYELSIVEPLEGANVTFKIQKKESENGRA